MHRDTGEKDRRRLPYLFGVVPKIDGLGARQSGTSDAYPVLCLDISMRQAHAMYLTSEPCLVCEWYGFIRNK